MLLQILLHLDLLLDSRFNHLAHHFLVKCWLSFKLLYFLLEACHFFFQLCVFFLEIVILLLERVYFKMASLVLLELLLVLFLELKVDCSQVFDFFTQRAGVKVMVESINHPLHKGLVDASQFLSGGSDVLVDETEPLDVHPLSNIHQGQEHSSIEHQSVDLVFLSLDLVKLQLELLVENLEQEAV